jgi:uncharacterized membrane protein YphA (DoxX/SURF4 family)
MTNIMDLLRRFLTSRYLALVLRLYIGGLFIYASMYKINYPGEFAESIIAYQIVPFWAVNVLAVVMPWLELLCGVLLIAGVRSKSATAMIGALLVLFTVAIATSLIRDIPIGCGCFHAVGEAMTWRTVLRDLTWLAMTVHIYFFDSALQLEKKFLISIRDI